jgi:hypothetical protein
MPLRQAARLQFWMPFGARAGEHYAGLEFAEVAAVD